MGLIAIFIRKPIVGIPIIIMLAVGAWMLVTPIYQFILDLAPWMPIWGWMIIGLAILASGVKLGLHVLF